MEKRINIAQTEPQLYKAMYGLEAATAKTELSKNFKRVNKKSAPHKLIIVDIAWICILKMLSKMVKPNNVYLY